VPVAASYTSDLAKVERVALAAALSVMKEVPGGDAQFTPLVRFTALSDSAVEFNVVLGVREQPDTFLVVHEFIKKLLERFAAEGIEIPFPTRTLRFSETDRGNRE
jgi:small-conductance mechanosensitive channel